MRSYPHMEAKRATGTIAATLAVSRSQPPSIKDPYREHPMAVFAVVDQCPETSLVRAWLVRGAQEKRERGRCVGGAAGGENVVE